MRKMVVATPRPSVTESAAAAAVLADIDVSSCGRDDDHVSVVSDSSNPRNSLLLNVTNEWRNEDVDKPLRRQMAMKIFNLLNKSNVQNSSVQWRRKLPALVRLIEAAHYRASPTRQAYAGSDLKPRVRALAVAFHREMKKHGDRTFNVPSQRDCMLPLPRLPIFIRSSKEPVLVRHDS